MPTPQFTNEQNSLLAQTFGIRLFLGGFTANDVRELDGVKLGIWADATLAEAQQVAQLGNQFELFRSAVAAKVGLLRAEQQRHPDNLPCLNCGRTRLPVSDNQLCAECTAQLDETE